MMVEKKQWHEKYFVDPLNKYAANRLIKSITGGINGGVNVLLIGSFLSIISIVISLIPGLNQTAFALKLADLKELVFGIVGMFFAYSIASSNAKYNKIDKQSVGFFAVIAYFIFMRPEFVEDAAGTTYFSLEFSRFGANGIFVAIISGLWAGEVSNFFKKRGWVISAEGLPDIIKTWFDYLIAGTAVTLGAWAFTGLLNIDLHTLFSSLLTPVVHVFTSFGGGLLINALSPLLFYFGIHPLSVITPVFAMYMTATAQNADLLARGLAPTVANGIVINNLATSFMLDLGGAGSTLGLNFAMLFYKYKYQRKLGQLAIFPSLLNINEPLIFGLPIMLNPMFFFPFLIAPVLNYVITYFVLYLGWIKIPSSMALSMHIPAFINAFILSEDPKAVILVILLIILDGLIWVPFLRLHAKELEAQGT